MTLRLVNDQAEAYGEVLVTINEAADRLKVKPRTIRRWLQTGELEGCGRGRRRRVIESSVDAFIGRNRDRAG